MLLLSLMLTASPLPPVIRLSADEAAAGLAAAQNADIFSDGHSDAFDATRDAEADVAAAFARAAGSGRMVMIVLGANWCHDSRALAALFVTDDFTAMLRDRYEVVFVDVGRRDRNLAIPARYGITTLAGTPTVLILSPEGQLLNRGTAASWRNAASRSRQTVYSAFANFRRARR